MSNGVKYPYLLAVTADHEKRPGLDQVCEAAQLLTGRGTKPLQEDCTGTARQMLHHLNAPIRTISSSFANKARVPAYFIYTPEEVAFQGGKCIRKRQEMERHNLPHNSFYGSRRESEFPLLEEKFAHGPTKIYVCQQKTRFLPVAGIKDRGQKQGKNILVNFFQTGSTFDV